MTNSNRDVAKNFDVLMHSRSFRHVTRRGGTYHVDHGPMRVLGIISGRNGITNYQLSEELDIRPSSVSASVRELEVRGLVVRKQSDQDRRYSLIHVTEAGRDLAAHTGDDDDARMADVFGILTDEERTTLVRLLEKLQVRMAEIDDASAETSNDDDYRTRRSGRPRRDRGGYPNRAGSATRGAHHGEHGHGHSGRPVEHGHASSNRADEHQAGSEGRRHGAHHDFRQR